MQKHNYVHVVRLHMAREGVSASALFVSPDEEDYRPLIELAKSMGITAEIEADPAPLCKVDGIIEWMKQFDRESTPEPAITRPEYEIRLDELTRAQRNTDRKLDMIAGMLADLVGEKSPRKANELQDQMVASANPDGSITHHRRYGIPDNSVPEASEAELQEQLDRPTPRFEHGEVEMRDATRFVTNQYTGAPGVLPGNMTTTAGSQVFGVGVDAEGKLAAVPVALPKVGDTLRPLSMRNGT